MLFTRSSADPGSMSKIKILQQVTARSRARVDFSWRGLRPSLQPPGQQLSVSPQSAPKNRKRAV
jgi:hypothetical protein